MSDEWLTTKRAAEILDCSAETVRAMAHDKILSGEKVSGQWQVKKDGVERIQSLKPSAPVPELPASLPPLKVDPGMVEVSMALAGIAAAIAAILPGVSGITENLKLLVAFLSGILAVFSAYSALWLLARYCLEKPSRTGFAEIWELLKNPERVGPYWLVALGLLVWLVLSALIGALAIVGG